MCSVSVVTDYYAHQQPSMWPSAFGGGGVGTLNMNWNTETVALLKEVIAKLDALDKKLGEPECVDERKEKYIAALEKIVELQGVKA